MAESAITVNNLFNLDCRILFYLFKYIYIYMYDKSTGKFVNVSVNSGGCKGCHVV